MRNAKRRLFVSFPLFVFLLPVIFAIVPQTAFGITLLHEFSGAFSRNDGCDPAGSLIVSDSTLYGMTSGGGGDAHNNTGVVFKMNADGTGYSHLHEFAWGAVDGMHPYGSLILSGSTLYGMTSEGGSHNKGVVFKVNTDGTGYGILHNFTGYTDDGAQPWGSLTLSGSTLYGMTSEGGSHNKGVVFELNTDGTGYGLLREFAGGDNDGAAPQGSLIVSGSTLYGVTPRGGGSDEGVVFKMNTDGSGFDLLHTFSEPGTNIMPGPTGSLVLSGSTLYGMAAYGGDYGGGVIFELNTDGTGYGYLHEFAGAPDDGRRPCDSLVLSGSTLYGMTPQGGDDYVLEYGVVFELNTDGSGFGLLHEFAGGADDGERPWGSLVISDSTLYGMTARGGDYDYGVVFSMSSSISNPEPSTLLLLAPAFLGIAGVVLKRRK